MGKPYIPKAVRNRHFRKVEPFDRPLLHEWELQFTERPSRIKNENLFEWWLSGDGIGAPYELADHEATTRYLEGSVYGGMAGQFLGKHRFSYTMGWGTQRRAFDLYPSMIDVTERNAPQQLPGMFALTYSYKPTTEETWGGYVIGGGNTSLVMPKTTITPFPTWGMSLGAYYARDDSPVGDLILNAEITGGSLKPYAMGSTVDVGAGDNLKLSAEKSRIDEIVKYPDSYSWYLPPGWGNVTYACLGAANDIKGKSDRLISSVGMRYLLDKGDPLLNAPVWLAASMEYDFKTSGIKYPHTFTLEGMASSSFMDGDGYGNEFRGSVAARAWLNPWRKIIFTGALSLVGVKPWGESYTTTETETLKGVRDGEWVDVHKETFQISPYYRYGGWGVDSRVSLQYKWLDSLWGTLDIGAVGGYQHIPENGEHGAWLGVGLSGNLGRVEVAGERMR